MTPILIDIDPFAPHSEACSFWHGGGCDCHPDALAAREVAHCHECDYVNAPSGARVQLPRPVHLRPRAGLPVRRARHPHSSRGARLLTVTRNVYYCEFCKRHRLTRNAIEKHEPRCIYNPNRSMCGWHMSEVPAAADLAVAFADDPDVGWLRRATDGCPACG
jgi:hypothetical protein